MTFETIANLIKHPSKDGMQDVRRITKPTLSSDIPETDTPNYKREQRMKFAQLSKVA